jgi:hypothetical protein
LVDADDVAGHVNAFGYLQTFALSQEKSLQFISDIVAV